MSSKKNKKRYKKPLTRYEKIRNMWELFLLYCIVGWLYEVVWCNIIESNLGFENRGFLFGPWLPIYGIGMTIIMIVFEKYNIKTPGKVFLIGASIACVAELIGSYVSEYLTGEVMWDYSKDFLNFQGRIALRPEFYFGFLILFGLYVIMPRFVKMQEKYNKNKVRNVISITLISLFVLDLIARIWLGSNYRS